MIKLTPQLWVQSDAIRQINITDVTCVCVVNPGFFPPEPIEKKFAVQVRGYKGDPQTIFTGSEAECVAEATRLANEINKERL